MSSIMVLGSQESVDLSGWQKKGHRSRRDPKFKSKHHPAPQALIVDDDVESIQPLQLVLRNFGFDITLAFDGREAFQDISKRNFDVVFLDISMPEMTGLEALQKIEDLQRRDRKSVRRPRPFPVVTYSSYALGDYDIPNGRSFFFADHWQKPVTLADLATLTNHIVDELGIKLESKEDQT